MTEHKAWEVYQVGEKYFFDAEGPCFGKQTYGSYDSKGSAECSMTECDAIWE